ncbi:MAG TPA: tetratricopeptide repeat protein [Alphaproteobacteria bacterium]|nr:tetratricopeptide repeat protein [Alphaproteobacteria bacterium]
MNSALEAALALEQAGHLLEAAAAYRQIGPDDPGHATALGRVDVIALAAGEAAEAGRWFERALDLDDDPDLWAELAQARAQEGKIEAAGECCRRALALDPDHFFALCRQGEFLAMAGQVGAAVESLQRALVQQPESPEANYILAFLLGLEGRHEEAIESYDRTLANRPDWPEALRQRSEQWLILGQLDQARRDLDEATRLDPADAFTSYQRGALEMAAGNTAAAIRAFGQVIERTPGDAALLLNTGIQLLALEQPDTAAPFPMLRDPPWPPNK